MANHYVPNLTLGPLVCQALRAYGITAPIDVHLMMKPVDDLILSFAKAGASSWSIHPEATEHLDRSIALIREQGCKAGMALNPATPLTALTHVLEKLEKILIMTVNPGFAGQAFIPSSLPKIQQAKRLIEQSTLAIHLQVDGGVTTNNIASIAQAGADMFVAGSSIFNSDDYASTITQMRQAAAGKVV